MKISKPSQIQTTVGDLITVLYEETQDLFNCKTNERQLAVAYILNDLTRNRFSPKHSRRPKRAKGNGSQRDCAGH